jgi:hypothetical protein
MVRVSLKDWNTFISGRKKIELKGEPIKTPMPEPKTNVIF